MMKKRPQHWYLQDIDGPTRSVTPGGRWVLAKPLDGWFTLKWKRRILGAWAVLRGKACAVEWL